ncbi:T9SS type A sorting domain-containing protein [Ginsengibacter hankyongi]|uniref:T9SS type A sorting domain-containing protein n=1 Tax=Ginsengibacter hankyongi TaxID=2607284 RepID=A0A5J5IP37_9BACT|nr:plastocyanin/azurin family copper-binding protein [Ginsengibacter hankyongi]KAA9041777.1 T9SS type A sorting domain-containing protein [Ginsengibacter hankyongi]
MKKILLPLFSLLFFQSKATTWNVDVQNFQFSPATLNVAVGDVIHWVWVAGTHTTTSVTIPAGAATWDMPMDITHTTYDYTVTQPGVYSYQCNFHAFLGMTASFTASGALPIILSSFSITTKNNMPLLSWSTQTELNADYYSIRRSNDGKNFNEIGKVAAAGNSPVTNNYSFTDGNISAAFSFVYYALGIVDKDGKIELSPIKIYKNKTATPRLIVSLSPNPVSSMGHLMVQFNADRPGVMLARLMDVEGKLVLKSELSAVQGINNGHIHLGNVPAGIYTLYFKLDGINESYRIVKN